MNNSSFAHCHYQGILQPAYQTFFKHDIVAHIQAKKDHRKNDIIEYPGEVSQNEIPVVNIPSSLIGMSNTA